MRIVITPVTHCRAGKELSL
jgi:hypothetical protein